MGRLLQKIPNHVYILSACAPGEPAQNVFLRRGRGLSPGLETFRLPLRDS